jgi:hypothetical protein
MSIHRALRRHLWAETLIPAVLAAAGGRPGDTPTVCQLLDTALGLKRPRHVHIGRDGFQLTPRRVA